MFQIAVEVTDAELESAYEHVNHAELVRLLERARYRYLEFIGQPFESLVKNGVLIVVSRIDVRYLREVRRGAARITVEEPRVLDKALLLTQRIYNQRDKLAVEATVELMFMSSKLRRAQSVPAGFLSEAPLEN